MRTTGPGPSSYPTPAERMVTNRAHDFAALGFSAVTATSPSSIQLTVDPARTRQQAANLRALVEADMEVHPSRHRVAVDVVHAAGPIDPMRASRAGIVSALRAVHGLEVDDSYDAKPGSNGSTDALGNDVLVRTADRSYAWSKLRATALDSIVRDVVTLPAIPGLRAPEPITVLVTPRKYRAEDEFPPPNNSL